MAFKVVNAMYHQDVDLGERLLKPLKATLVNGSWRTEDEIISNAADADALLFAGGLQRRTFSTLSRCRIAASLGVGYERVDIEAATEYGIVVTNTPDYCIDEVSGRAMALMLALGHKLFQLDKAVRERRLHIVPSNRKAVEEITPIFRMRDQTLGIVGLGRIGMATALKARGLGMRVIACDPHVLGAVMVSHGVEPVDFDTLLMESDFISIHSLVTEETRNMFSYAAFKKMKPTCYFVNTARGVIVDLQALTQALQEGLIAGAGLDVSSPEPLPADHPLLKMPNVIHTGHSAWYSTAADSETEFWHKPMKQVVLALNGEWPPYAVNPDVQKKWLEKWGQGS